MLVAYRLIAPGSEWFLHREWFGKSALADLLGGDFGLAEAHKLYACHDLLLAHKQALFGHLVDRWRDLFNARFDVLLYDLTSTYFKSDPPQDEADKRRFGYSRDKRSDCVQVVIALVVTPEGLPLAYEVLAGNTADNTTLRVYLAKIEAQYGKARRVFVMDRGIPTEAVLAEMRQSDPPVQYLVGTPKGQLQPTRARSPRQALARGQTRRAGQAHGAGRGVLRAGPQRRPHDQGARHAPAPAQMAVGAAQAAQGDDAHSRGAAHEARRVPPEGAGRLAPHRCPARRSRRLIHLCPQSRQLHQARRREGRYLLRTNLAEDDPADLWAYYLQLVAVEEAFKTIKGDLAIRPIFHQSIERIEAHIFVAFLAYCLYVTLARRLNPFAPGLTARSIIEKFAAVQMIDLHVPTTDGRELRLTRYTEPEPELRLILDKLRLVLPAQQMPTIASNPVPQADPCSEDLSPPAIDSQSLSGANSPIREVGLRLHPPLLFGAADALRDQFQG